MEEDPEAEHEELKELIDGLLELATNAGRDVKKRMGMVFIVHRICISEGHLGY
jgi:hypothetical protein